MTRDALSKLLEAHNGGRLEEVLAALRQGRGGSSADGRDKKQDSRGEYGSRIASNPRQNLLICTVLRYFH